MTVHPFDYLQRSKLLHRGEGDWEMLDDAAMFERVCRRIEEAFKRLKKRDPGHRKVKPSHKWLKRVVYEFVTILYNLDAKAASEHFEHRIERYGRNKQGRKSGNVFKRALLAIITNADDLSVADRHRFGNELFWAAKHFIEPPFLEGFIATSRPNQTDGYSKESLEIDPDYAFWTARMLAMMPAHFDPPIDEGESDEPDAVSPHRWRGKYPENVVKIKTEIIDILEKKRSIRNNNEIINIAFVSLNGILAQADSEENWDDDESSFDFGEEDDWD